MLERAPEIASHPAIESAKVAAAPVAVLAYVNLTPLNAILQLALVVITIGYTIWKWRRESRKDRNR